jgi:hypothetical protein
VRTGHARGGVAHSSLYTVLLKKRRLVLLTSMEVGGCVRGRGGGVCGEPIEILEQGNAPYSTM